jgi:RNA:NAD 2'-phosphotransferase (TPT1/KptA family)
MNTTAIRAQSGHSQVRTESPESDPAMSQILDFLAADINAFPERLQAGDPVSSPA